MSDENTVVLKATPTGIFPLTVASLLIGFSVFDGRAALAYYVAVSIQSLAFFLAYEGFGK